MSAPISNKNAEKWTLEKTLDILNRIHQLSYSDDCLYLGHALCLTGYYDDIWAYWRRKWKGKYEVIHLMKRIMQRFEFKLFEKMCNGKMPAHAAKFALTHHYGWGRDPQQKQYEDTSYLDNTPPDEEIPEEVTEALAVQEQEKPQAPIEKEKKESARGTMTTDEFRKYHSDKIKLYNGLNPLDQILTTAAFFEGPPPSGLNVIEFDGGYFLKEQNR